MQTECVHTGFEDMGTERVCLDVSYGGARREEGMFGWMF